ncbi:MAG: polysaccharide deacetylase family protein [Firmicutes bacterium]|nr:polysaccharide deacetylase family protein [Bacillota bacterium]
MLVIIGRNWHRLVIAAVVLLALVHTAELALVGAARAVIATVSGRLVPVYFVATADNKVAFTFEGGFGRDRTTEILGVLKEHDVRAAFFLSGKWVTDHPLAARHIVSCGHDLGNYTYSVPHPNSLLASELKRELEKAHKTIEEVTGRAPKVFRPPYGEYSNKVIETARDLGYETVVWSIDSLDWRGAPAADMKARILGKIHKGAIVRFHVTGAHTVEALPLIIAELKKQGYAIVPLSSLLLEGRYYIHPHTGEQRPIEPPGDAGRHERRSPIDA